MPRICLVFVIVILQVIIPAIHAYRFVSSTRSLNIGSSLGSTRLMTMMAGGRGRGGGGAASSKARSPNKRVAIIGGGISGLACAKELQALGLDPIVYDTGRLYPGGRCSTRVLETKDKEKVLFDHSAQFLSTPKSKEKQEEEVRHNGSWVEWMEEMKAKGVLKEWKGANAIGTLSKGGKFRPMEGGKEDGQDAWIGRDGMRSIPIYLAEGIRIDRPIWISKVRINADGSWRLWHYQDMLGDVEYLVIAHNGKCAARLMKSPGEVVAPVQKYLETKFGAKLRYDPPNYMQLCGLWVLMAVFDEPVLPASLPTFQGAFVEGVPEVSWIANNGLKLGQTGFVEEGTKRSAWTIISSPTFAEKNKCPQENVSSEKAEKITRALLLAFERALGISSSTASGEGEGLRLPTLRPSVTAVQLWGAANPISVADLPRETPFMFQASTGVGACGDWLLSPSIHAAAESGIKLAQHIHQHHQAKQQAKAQSKITSSSLSEGKENLPISSTTSAAGKVEGEVDRSASSLDEILGRDIGLDYTFKAVGGPGAKAIASFPSSRQEEEESRRDRGGAHHQGGQQQRQKQQGQGGQRQSPSSSFSQQQKKPQQQQAGGNRGKQSGQGERGGGSGRPTSNQSSASRKVSSFSSSSAAAPSTGGGASSDINRR